MVIEFRSLLFGAAVGLIAGIYISPAIKSPKIQTDNDYRLAPINDQSTTTKPKVNPTDQQAIKAIFQFQNWSLKDNKDKANAIINKCGQSISSMICDISLKLDWAKEDQNILVEFTVIDDQFVVLRLKPR